MIFTRFEFIFAFLPAVLLVSYLLPRSYVIGWLALTSVFFYGWSAGLAPAVWIYALPFLLFVVINYLIGKQIERHENASRRRFLVWTVVICNVGWWFFLKENLSAGLGLFTETVVSVGLGFYVLRAVGYAVDVYHRRMPAASGLPVYFLYLAFFAHMPSGPITSWKWFSSHLTRYMETKEAPAWRAGFYLFSIGLLKKAIADTIGGQIDPIIDGGNLLGFAAGWIVLMGYTAQIYLDFAGYTDMALGIGRLIGIQLPPNFASPYLKRNPIEFWNAWHITLSHWLRDYIFTPLGRLFFSITALKRSPLMIAVLCYLITFTICGIWHGIQGTFFLWGFYHGIGLSCCKLYGELTRKRFSRAYYAFMFNTRTGYILAMSATFLFVSVGWVFFRSHSISQSAEWLKGLLGYYGREGSTVDPNLMLGLGVLLIAAGLISRFPWQAEKLAYWQRIVLTANFMVVLFYYYISENVGMSPFIYNVF